MAQPENKDDMIQFLIERMKLAEDAIVMCE